MLGSLLLAPVLWAQPATANAIKAVVGGQIIITQWDVNREARLTRLDPALAQKKLEQDALLVMNIKSQKIMLNRPVWGNCCCAMKSRTATTTVATK